MEDIWDCFYKWPKILQNYQRYKKFRKYGTRPVSVNRLHHDFNNVNYSFTSLCTFGIRVMVIDQKQFDGEENAMSFNHFDGNGE